jgi:hypothetical protein
MLWKIHFLFLNLAGAQPDPAAPQGAQPGAQAALALGLGASLVWLLPLLFVGLFIALAAWQSKRKSGESARPV